MDLSCAETREVLEAASSVEGGMLVAVLCEAHSAIREEREVLLLLLLKKMLVCSARRS